jgi:hypothetical protein
MDDRTLLAVCIADEAGLEPFVGKLAVGRVVLNRMRLKFQSDGTIPGTVLRKDQFSGFYFEMVGGKYTRVASTIEQAAARAVDKLTRYKANAAVWADSLYAADLARLGLLVSSREDPMFPGFTERTVNYYNPKVVKTPPAWATPDRLDTVIFNHTFYHA